MPFTVSLFHRLLVRSSRTLKKSGSVLSPSKSSDGTRPPHHPAARTNMVLLIRPTLRPGGYAYRVLLQPARASNAGSLFTLPQAYLLGFWALITLLVLNGGPVHAEWELVSGDDASKLTVYIDRGTIERSGDLAKMWQLFDYKTVQTVAGDSLLSFQRYNEYDCSGSRTRMLAYTWFSSNMGRGRIVYKTTEAQPWASLVPRSIDQTLWKVACGKP